MSGKLNRFLLYPGGAVIFMIFALYNTYPIVNSDTATYLNSGFKMYVPADRPVFYGIFTFISSLGISAWFTIFVQSLILAYLSVRFIRTVVGLAPARHIIVLLGLISLGTTAGWNSGQLMPDIFTAILFLSSYLFLLERNNKWQNLLLTGIIYLATVVHYSHVLITILFSVILIVCSYLFKTDFLFIRRKAVLLGVIAFTGLLSVFSTNYFAGLGFVSSKYAHIFLMGKLSESGVLGVYLNRSCNNDHPYKICTYRDQLPAVASEFIWDQQNSPVFKTGGWDANKAEYNAIIKNIASSTAYWPLLFYKSIEGTLRQIVLLNIDEAEEGTDITLQKGNPLYSAVANAFPHETNQLMFSRQTTRTLNVPFYDRIYVMIFILSGLVMLFLPGTDMKKKAVQVYLTLVLFLFINAFVTATFANVHTRLNSRAIWLLPMVNMIFIYKYLSAKWTRRAADSNE